MKHRLLNLLTALSLLLCVAVCVLWVRSYWRSDSIVWSRNNLDDPDPTPGQGFLVEKVTADFECGRARLRWWRYQSSEWTGSVPEPGFRIASNPSRGYASDFSAESRLGVWLHRSIASVDLHFADSRHQRVWGVGVPLWLVAALAAVLPGFRAFARSRSSARPGLCPACGYDLRATSGRCPECGTPATTPT